MSPDNPSIHSYGTRAGQVGFGRDMGATRALLGGDEPGQAISATQAGLAEAEMGLIDPLRRYKLWRPVRPHYVSVQIKLMNCFPLPLALQTGHAAALLHAWQSCACLSDGMHGSCACRRSLQQVYLLA